MPVQVVIDGRPLYDSARFRGIGVYLRSLLGPLGQHPGLSVSALVTRGTSLPSGIQPVWVRRTAPGRFAQREHALRMLVDTVRADGNLLHSPNIDPPLSSRRPFVQTLYDVIPLSSGVTGFGSVERLWRRRAKRMRMASAVIAISQHTADEGIRFLGLDPNRVFVAPLGVASRFTPTEEQPSADSRYVLYVGEFGPAKGYAEAFAVIGKLAELGYPHVLRVVGRIAPWVQPEVDALVASSPRPDRIVLEGFVAEDRIVSLYQRADALLVTSRAEGFGLPALEAMACATPVIAFANTSLPEVVGDGGVLVADGDVAGFVEETRRVLDDQEWRSKLGGRGRKRSKRFTWEGCAEKHAEVFQAVASGALGDSRA